LLNANNQTMRIVGFLFSKNAAAQFAGIGFGSSEGPLMQERKLAAPFFGHVASET